ncbi:MAG: DASS family sodium-coupled anion symporter [Verrucomicrobia bacterium]|nr:DASS family sodium-coupled anion symporter [Verrucomicrobiota bacterium]
MNTRKAVGILLGLAGFCLPWLVTFPGLSFPGHVTLGVFLLAAAFWLTEPVPIYITSMLAIFLEVLLLSAEGPLCQFVRPPVAQPEVVAPTQTFRLPAGAVTSAGEVFVARPAGNFDKLKVEVVERRADVVEVRSPALSASTPVLSRSDHWLARYSPASYRTFFASLADPIIILFLGGCLLADASVKYRLDRALTRLFLRPVGTNPKLIVLGLLVATGVLSAFMSNTATTAMMMTVVLPLLAGLDADDPLKVAVVLAIPIGANIGGIATPIGTPPNAIALAALTKQGLSVPFVKWVLMALPIVLVTLVLSWLVLLKLFRPRTRELKTELGGTFDRSPKAWGLYVVFGLTALLWFTENQHGISSNIIAFLPVVALPMFGIVGKKEIHALPWDVFWLMAGGISLGTAIKTTGLAEWMVGRVEWSALGGFAIMAGLALLSFLLANFLSHTVTVTLLAPIAVSVGTVAGAATGFDLTTALIAVAVASSYGMTLPISTPPNAIAMGSGVIQTQHLVKAGGLIGIVGMALVLVMTRFFWPLFSR